MGNAATCLFCITVPMVFFATRLFFNTFRFFGGFLPYVPLVRFFFFAMSLVITKPDYIRIMFAYPPMKTELLLPEDMYINN